MRLKHLRIGILVAVVTVVPLPAVRAAPICDCFYYPYHSRAVREAEAIFIGKVTKVERSPEKPEDFRDVTQAVTFEVLKIWKGPKFRNVRAWEHLEHTMCAKWKFTEGEKYLIYADLKKGVWVVNGYCARTRPLETNDAEAIREFNQLNSPAFMRKAKR